MKRKTYKVLGTVILLAFVWVFASGMEAESPQAAAASRAASGLVELQNAIAKSLLSREEKLLVDYRGDKDELNHQVKDTIRSAIAEDDYTAYIVESYFYSIRSWGGESHIKLNMRYRESEEQTAVVDQEVERVLAKLITPSMNEHQKVKAVHDWIVVRLAYDTSLEKYTAYEAITTGKAVCQGYSLLTYRMLEAAGIPVRIVEGKVESGDHAWNMVKLGGKWYHLDVTWNDPVPDQPGRVSYAYYLKSDDEMRLTHSWTREYPAASAIYADELAQLADAEQEEQSAVYDSLEYSLGLHWLKEKYTASDWQELRSRIEKAIESGSEVVSVRYLQGEVMKGHLELATRGVTGLSAFRAQYTPYGSDGAVLLELTLVR